MSFRRQGCEIEAEMHKSRDSIIPEETRGYLNPSSSRRDRLAFTGTQPETRHTLIALDSRAYSLPRRMSSHVRKRLDLLHPALAPLPLVSLNIYT